MAVRGGGNLQDASGTMAIDHDDAGSLPPSAPARKLRLRRFFRSREGSAAIEFALLAIPYFVIIFATVETFVCYAGEQLVANAVDKLSRQMRTGQIAATITKEQFRQAFCNEISILIKCSPTEVNTPEKLFLDVEHYNDFSDIVPEIPRMSSDPRAPLNTSALKFSPGGPETINMVRAFYRWQIVTDLVRPFLSDEHRPDGSMDYLMISTSTFKNEKY
ncbi:Flp pilus assembly protein TadG [Rhizobium sp. BK251]|nr:Flp pilus assembly protein TadG [Rhizobium sp. BK251]